MTNNHQLALIYGRSNTRPSALLNSIFMSTVNTAAKTLVAVASSSTTEHFEKWKPVDHLRFMFMLMTWLTVWILRILMDHFPFSGPVSSASSSSPYQMDLATSHFGSFELLASSSSSALSSALSVFSSSASPAESSLDLVLSEESDAAASVKALGRALTNVSFNFHFITFS